MPCELAATAMGNWSTGRVNVQTVNTENVKSFLGVSSPCEFFPQPQVTDGGVLTNANLAQAAATAVAIATTAASVNIANKQQAIANSYYNMARQKWDRFLNSYKPCETKEIAEACNTPEYVPQYDTQADAYENNVNVQYGIATDEINDLSRTYCVSIDNSLFRDLALSQAQLSVDSSNFAYRYEEHRKDTKDDVRWNRRSQALNRGRNLQNEAASYAQAASKAYGSLGNSVQQAAEGASTMLGYLQTRRDTVYPTRIALQQPSASMVGSGGFIGVNGGNSIVSPTPMPTGDSVGLNGYSNNSTFYSTTDTIGSAVSKQGGF